ncbi:MAG: methyl-accepting chemotaxis protein [Bacillota bacterium]|nr:methyl-accepting chemotaxis protein [Bacillota bacterium]
MENSKKKSTQNIIARDILINFILAFLASVVFAIAELLIFQSTNIMIFRAASAVVFVAADSAVLVVLIKRTKKMVKTKIDELMNKNEQFEGILDALPFPVHVTDNNMMWTYMNKAFENTIVSSGAVKDRQSAYGLPCSNAGANICNTENCGIRQLREKNKAETFFDWGGAKNKQDTAVVKDHSGNAIGYVEIVTNLTAILTVNEYTKNEIERLSNNLDLISNGDLNVDLKIAPANQHTQEISELFAKCNDSLKKVKNSINMLVSDADMLSVAAVEGRLSTRADATKHQGDFRKVVDGVNHTLDAVIGPLNVAADYVDKISNGNIPEKITDNYNGDFNIIKNNLNTCIDAVNLLVSDATMLSVAAVEGRLSTRGDSSKHQGDFRKIVEGVNQTLDSIVTPLNEADHVLGKMAMNDYTTKMSNNYKGDLEKLGNAINGVHERLIAIEQIVIHVGAGDLSDIERLEKIGKRSENDSIAPSLLLMTKSIRNLIDESDMLASAAIAGNLGKIGDESIFQGGYRKIINGINRLNAAIVAPLNEASTVLQKFASGDLTVEMTGEYQGEYNTIKTSLNNALAAFNELLSEINTAASQVSSGASQVSNASQSLSTGAAEQASSVEELTSSVTEVASQTKQNATNATQASDLSTTVKEEAARGNEKMTKMLDAMSEINESSANISKIIKVIDDIAFQTNILALNAAVEAARAGQNGKGFAVVAEEVRNLAGKSAQAAKETTSLIEGSINKVEIGTKIANETANMLGIIVESAQKSAALVSDIATASTEQAAAIAQIDQGLMQVSTVVQTNSATSEESAASSEELSGQANILMEMVGKFKLKNSLSGISGNTAESLRKITSYDKSSQSTNNAGKREIIFPEKLSKY